MKIKLILLMMAMSLIWTGCASQKKLDSGDEFSVDDSPAASGKPSDDLSLDGAAPAPAKGGSDDLTLDEPAAKPTAAAKSDASDMDAALENELNSLDNGAAPQPAPKAAANNELSLDEPTAPVAQNTPPAAPEVAPPPEVAVAPEVAAPVPEPSVAAPVASGAPVTINNVQYKGNNNGGAVTIAADQPLQFTTRFNSITNQFIVEVQNSTIPKKLTRTLNTKDMASSIGSVDIYQKSGSNVARFVVQLRPGSSEPIVQPEGNALLIIGAAVSGGTNSPSSSVADSGSPAPIGTTETPVPAPETNDSFVIAAKPTEETVRRTKGGVLDYENLEDFLMGEQQFTGKKISIEASGIKVSDAISFLSEESGTNIVMDDAVGSAGVINNIRLREVPWDQALVMILKAKKLIYKRQGNVLLITSLDALKKEEDEAINLRESRKAQEPLVVKRFFIAYADIAELKIQVDEYMKSLPVSKAPTAAVNKVIIDKRNNSLIVTETETNLKNIEQIIKAIDTQPKQVLIESKIVVADETFTRSLGIKWGATGRTETPNAVVTIDPGGVTQNILHTDISWGQIDFLGSLTSTLNFGEQQRQLKVLASPTITVLSNVAATITKTTDVTQTTTQTTTNPQTGAPINNTLQSLIPVGMTLQVTPVVTNENTVYLKLDLTRSTKSAADAGKTQSNAKTEMFVKSGLTAVVGGIYESSQDDKATGVPGLRQIPVLGKLFEASDKITEKNELMMFITPTILRPL